MSGRYDDFDRALLRAGRSARAPSGMRARALAAAGAGGATALAASSKATASVLSSLAAKCAVVVAVGAASIGAAAVVTRAPDPPLAPTVVEPPPVPSTFVQYAPIAPKAVEAVEVAPAREPPPPSPKPQVVVTAPPGPSALAEEIRLVDGARRALADGDAGSALRLVEEHASRFAGGTFAVERDVLRIDALVATGREDEAAARARDFVARHPSSAQAARIEKIGARR